MERQGIEIIKDFFLSILIVAAIIAILSVIFYDKISLSKVIPETEEYKLTEEMKNELESSNLDDAQEVVVNYYINKTELKKYKVEGKRNPFDSKNTINEDYNTIENNTLSDNNTSNGFYPDDGTK